MAKDANFSQVSLLLHCDGANGSTNIVDSSQYTHPSVTYGNAAISTADMLFGKPSLAFDGAGDYIILPDADALEFGSSDFTLELQTKTTQTRQYAALIGRDDGSFSAGAFGILLNGPSSGAVELWMSDFSISSPLLSAPSAAINNNAWHHLAITRSGSTWRLFKNGTQVASGTYGGAVTNTSQPMNIGRQAGYLRDFAGSLAQIRMTKGLARYTANFTPPAAAFLAGGNLTGVVRDASGNPAARSVRSWREDTRGVSGATISDATTGAYSMPVIFDTAHTVVAYPAVGENLPALVHHGVIPI